VAKKLPKLSVDISLEDSARMFAKKTKSDFNWAFANILKFIQFQASNLAVLFTIGK
jgi:hypothetical protein